MTAGGGGDHPVVPDQGAEAAQPSSRPQERHEAGELSILRLGATNKSANIQGGPKKRGIERKMGITSFKYIRKGNVGRGCFGKFRIFATRWALRSSKLNQI